MSQERLGEALGITFQQVHKYESGTDRIGASRLQQIAKTLGVSIEFFFEGLPRAKRRDTVTSDGNEAEFLSTPEGVQLARAFLRVTNPKARHQFISLVKAIAEDEGE